MKVASTYKGVESTAASMSLVESADGTTGTHTVYPDSVAPDADVSERYSIRPQVYTHQQGRHLTSVT